ncbi:MAG: DNA recombination protein RmuC [Chitinophagaceae bacterium]
MIIGILAFVVGILIGKFILSNKPTETEQQKQDILKLEKENAILQTQNSNLEQRLKEQKEELSQLQEKLTKDFQLIAHKVLEENSNKFSQQHKTSLDIIISPLKEKIKSFEEKVQHVYESESAQRNILKGEIKQLMELNQQMSSETQNLTNALKGNVKTQGNWGEFILEKLLEKSGLVKDREYQTQVSMSTEEGKKCQPDVLIYLPEDKCLVIDAKTSLIAYNEFVSSENEIQKEVALKAHLQSIKNHVKELSNKNYQQLYEIKTLDFVLLFMPIEPAFSLAMQYDNTLFNDAFDKNIIIVSPSTLLATLRTIANIWRQEYQNKNAIEIATKAGNLYDKFVGFLGDLEKVGNKMNEAHNAYKDAMNKGLSGTGNIVKKMEDLKKLGVTAGKAIPSKYIDRAE